MQFAPKLAAQASEHASLVDKPSNEYPGEMNMKTSQILAAAALTLFAAVGAQAETYQA